jgi:hypothetical protein
LKTETTDPFEWLCTTFLKISLLIFIPYFLITVFVCQFLGYFFGFILMVLGSIASFFKSHFMPSDGGLSVNYTEQSQNPINNQSWLETNLWPAIVVISIILYCSYFFLPFEKNTQPAHYHAKSSSLNSLSTILKAAENGDIATQILLGKKYQNGIDVSQDFKEAEKWYSKAAKQGSAIARRHLVALDEEWCNFIAQEQTCYLPRFSNEVARPAIQNLIISNQMQPDEVFVQSYMRKNGTYVQAHRRTKADKTLSNNWSSFGNINPYTGKRGLATPMKSGHTYKH